ncbi:MAG: hypothetical protein HW412_2578, partial [Bacteroidetes bacterium]|nr:hypothetical protein [Bacteroidota bacterium]
MISAELRINRVASKELPRDVTRVLISTRGEETKPSSIIHE